MAAKVTKSSIIIIPWFELELSALRHDNILCLIASLGAKFNSNVNLVLLLYKVFFLLLGASQLNKKIA